MLICEDKNLIIKIKKNNAKLYPIYKMLSFDLLFYYAISFLFLTTTKGFSYVEVLLIESCLPLIKAIVQIPLYFIINKIGKKKSLVLGNFLIIIYLLQLMECTNLTSLILAVVILAVGVTLKDMTASNILYESVNNKEGKGMYSIQEERGLYYYYFLDSVLALIAGFLFVKNPYYPIIMSTILAVLAFCVSLLFRDVSNVINKEKKSETKKTQINIANVKDILNSITYIFKSQRLRALFYFGIVFSSFIYVFAILRRAMLASVDISPEYFSMIFAGLIFAGGISTLNVEKIKKMLGRNILTVISFATIISGVLAAIVYNLNLNNTLTIVILFVMFLIQYVCVAPYTSLMEKYLKSFSKVKTRNKIRTVYNILIYLFQSIITFIASYILGYFNISVVVLMITIVYFILIIVISKFMSGRLGLNPEEYSKDDIEILNTKKSNKPI